MLFQTYNVNMCDLNSFSFVFFAEYQRRLQLSYRGDMTSAVLLTFHFQNLAAASVNVIFPLQYFYFSFTFEMN